MIPTTVLIPTSPIPSAPDTSIIEETVQSVKDRIECDLIVMVDGVRPEQELQTDVYAEYVRRVVLLSDWKWDARPVLYPWLHQAALTLQTLPLIETPTVLFVEHDTPLIGDIPFLDLLPIVESGTVNVVRFYHEAEIHPDHAHLTTGTADIGGMPLTFTKQWSQRPFLANTEWLRNTMSRFFTADSRCFIEDRLHGPAQNEPWGNWRIALYTPEGVIKRSTHLDGRGDAPKYDESQTW